MVGAAAGRGDWQTLLVAVVAAGATVLNVGLLVAFISTNDAIAVQAAAIGGVAARVFHSSSLMRDCIPRGTLC